MSDKQLVLWSGGVMLLVAELLYIFCCIVIDGKSPKWYGFITFPIGLALTILIAWTNVAISTGRWPK